MDTIEWFQVVASLKSIKFNPLIFFPLRALFLRYLTVEFRLTPPSSDYSAHFHLLSQMARNRGEILGTFTLQSHGRPKMKVFQKTPSNFASKN